MGNLRSGPQSGILGPGHLKRAEEAQGHRRQLLRQDGVPTEGLRAPSFSWPSSSVPLLALRGREGQGPLEILQLDFEMENFTSHSVKRRIMWHIDYRGHGALPDLERAVTELTVIQRDVQAILPLAMVSGLVTGPVAACVSVRGEGDNMAECVCAYRHTDGPTRETASSIQVCMCERGRCALLGGRQGSGVQKWEQSPGRSCSGEVSWRW